MWGFSDDEVGDSVSAINGVGWIKEGWPVLLKAALSDKETTKDDGEQRKGFAGIKERPAGKKRELIKTVERWGQDGKRREKKDWPPACCKQLPRGGEEH